MVEETPAIDRRSKGQLRPLVLVALDTSEYIVEPYGQSLDAVTGYNAGDTTRCTDHNTTNAIYIKQLVFIDSPEAKTTRDRSFITYLPKNQDGATRRTQHNNL